MSRNPNAFSLKTRWVLRRNAILGSARFQHWAFRLPLLRSIARRKAATQFDLVAGFVYSQILSASVESGLLGYLETGPRSAVELRDFLKLPEQAGQRLLRAAAALDLVESPQRDLWTLGEAGAALAHNGGALAMIRHHGLLYRDLVDPLDLLAADRREETALSAFWSYASRSPGSEADPASAYSALMAASQPMVATEALAAHDFSRHRRLLDVGGGSGAFVRAVLAATPELEGGIFDLPGVIDGATPALTPLMTGGRLSLHRGSFRKDPLPMGYDAISLVRILHDHDDDVVASLLARTHAALPPGGQLLIVEPMAGAAAARRMGDAYFGLYLWAMGSGRPRTANEYRVMLQDAGFTRVRAVSTRLPLVASMIVAMA